jgi:hypothetical protein
VNAKCFKLEVISLSGDDTFTFRVVGSSDSHVWLEDDVSSLPQPALEAVLNRWQVNLYAICTEDSTPEDPLVVSYVLGDEHGPL